MVSDIKNEGYSQGSSSPKVVQETTFKHLLELEPHSAQFYSGTVKQSGRVGQWHK